MPKKHEPTQQELDQIEREIYYLLQEVPEGELRIMLERCLEARMRCGDLDVDLTDSECESESEETSTTSEEEEDFRHTD